MTPEGWGILSTVIAGSGGLAGILSIIASRRAAKDSPYEALAARVVAAEQRIETLETELRTERERSAHLAAAFRTRIQVLLRHIAALDEYAQILGDVIRAHRIPFEDMPRKPDLPSSPTDEL